MRERKKQNRKQNTTVLFLTNGNLTEDQYLGLVKSAIHKKHGNKFAVTVKKYAGVSPHNLYLKTQSPMGDLNAYDHVWVVVDKDDYSLDEFLKCCRKEHLYRTRRKKGAEGRCYYAVVSNPCFEVLLVSHFEKIRVYQSQKDAQHHYEKAAGIKEGEKNLPESVVLTQLDAVCSNAKLSGREHIELNTEGASPGTAMPYLFQHYHLVE